VFVLQCNSHLNNNIYFFNVAPCMLPHLFYNPTHTLFTL
jgi:hypothetical protein